jgi:hypothetical protein
MASRYGHTHSSNRYTVDPRLVSIRHDRSRPDQRKFAGASRKQQQIADTSILFLCE